MNPEAAILADPEAYAGYVVYADWLQQRGDPRGELMAVQLALELDDDPALRARETELLAAHRDEWLDALSYPMIAIDLTWRRGGVHAATIPCDYEGVDPSWIYPMLYARPVARFLRELTIGVTCTYGGRGPDDTSFIDVLATIGAPPALRRLAFEPLRHQISWTHLGDLTPIYTKLAGLEELHVEAGRITLGEIALPNLRKLHVVTGGLRAHVLASIARASWPCLDELVIYFGTERYGGDCRVEDVRPLLDCTRVTKLGLCNSEFADEIAQVVVGSRALPGLRHLDLSRGTLGDGGAQTLLDHHAALAHLETLDISESFVSPHLCRALAEIGPRLIAGGQQEIPDYGPFVSIGE